MIRCQHCGEEVEDGRAFCPHCGKPLAEGGAAAAATQDSSVAPTTALRQVDSGRGEASSGGRDTTAERPAARAALSSFDRGKEDADKSRRMIFIAVALASALAVAGLAWWATRPSARTGEPRLEGALRPGAPEFEQIRERLILDFDADEDALIGPTALGTYAVTMRPTVRNFTGRAVSGLEFHAAGLDLDKRVIRERTFVWLDEIEPNKVSVVPFSLNFPQDNRPASLDLKLTGVRFK